MEVMGAGVGVGSVRGIFAGPEVDGQFRMSDSVSRCSSDVLLCKRTPSKLLCPHYRLAGVPAGGGWLVLGWFQVICICWCIRGSETGVIFEESHEVVLRIRNVCVMVDVDGDHLRCVCTSYAQHQQMQQASILLEKRVFTSFQNSFMLNGFGSSSQ